MNSYIDSINQATAAATGRTADGSDQSSVLGKEDFLQLLVAQLQNQDPLNPDEPTEFTAQLAQFSSLEQLTNMNDSMEALVNASSNSDRLSTLNTIGNEVLFEADEVNYSGGPLQLGYRIDENVESATLVLENNGAVIATIQATELTAGTHYLNWDGTTINGIAAPTGKYSLRLQATGKEGEAVTGSTLVRAEVTGVDLQGEKGATLVTDVGEVAFNSILGVFDPKIASLESAEKQQQENNEQSGEQDQQG